MKILKYEALAIIEIINLSKTFGAQQALANLNLSIPEQSIFGLLGPNGAGKTSLIRILTQIFNADSGKIMYKGELLNPSHLSRIGYLPEERGLYRKMFVEEQLIYFGRLRNMKKDDAREKANFWLKKLDLLSWKNKSLEALSKGMQQKVQFIVAVLHNPELIVLDEPFSGFDPVNSEIITEEILNFKKEGKTIIFSTHRMETVESLCDSIALIHKGHCVLEGGLQDIKQKFKNNTFRLEGGGPIATTSPVYEIHSMTKKNNNIDCILKLQSGYTSNDLLTALLPDFSITGFNEVLPTMSEIFISQVTNLPAATPHA